MTHKEAILRIVDHNEIHSRKDKHFAIHITEALNMAVEALKKQIPQQVEITDDCCICPNCRFDMMGVYDFSNYDTKDPSYCPECGQALDWGDDKCSTT